jgi:chaperonin cofactor prefoldin
MKHPSEMTNEEILHNNAVVQSKLNNLLIDTLEDLGLRITILEEQMRTLQEERFTLGAVRYTR